MNPALRRLGIGLGMLLGLAVVVAIVLFLAGSSKVNRTYEIETATLNIVTDSASLAHGAHLVQINGCTDCHTANFGGQVFADEPPFRVVASNLTRGAGGVGGQYTAELFDRAIRHGVGADGKSLLVMPSKGFHNMSDDDVADIISYLLQLPPVDHELPATLVRPLGRLLATFALDPTYEVSPEPARVDGPSVQSAEWGAYFASGICAYCHGEDLRGAQPPNPSSPPAPDLASVGKWTPEQFIRTMRTGVTPGNRELNPEFMPWTVMAHATDDELLAIHAYLTTLAD